MHCETCKNENRSGELNPAVLPICNRLAVETEGTGDKYSHSAECHSAIQQIGNLRYEQNEAARERMLSLRGEPLLFADWLRPVFMHFEVPAAALQRDLPFELDLHEGKAYVSLVAFTMRGMRPCRGGKISEWLFKPIATNDFLNLRTYVRHRGEPGIYFLTEWMNNRISVRLGPWTFGLPYRFGETNYQHWHESGELKGIVRELGSGLSFKYEAEPLAAELLPCPAGSLDEFLLERYTAFTAHGRSRRFFRIWHSPWLQQPVRVSILERRLVSRKWDWFADAKCVGGNYSVGARNVWMGRPHRV
jgi:uncharacterized protein YqjF (DUF2071 family)